MAPALQKWGGFLTGRSISRRGRFPGTCRCVSALSLRGVDAEASVESTVDDARDLSVDEIEPGPRSLV